MVDTSFNQGYFLCVFYGMDQIGAQTVMFVTVSKEVTYKHYLCILEKYEEAGFRPPEHVLADSQSVIDAFRQKYGSKAIQYELCKYKLLKDLKQ